jgi:hypothetical protein
MNSISYEDDRSIVHQVNLVIILNNTTSADFESKK